MKKKISLLQNTNIQKDSIIITKKSIIDKKDNSILKLNNKIILLETKDLLNEEIKDNQATQVKNAENNLAVVQKELRRTRIAGHVKNGLIVTAGTYIGYLLLKDRIF